MVDIHISPYYIVYVQVRLQHQSDILQQIAHQKCLKNREKQKERNEFEDAKVSLAPLIDSCRKTPYF